MKLQDDQISDIQNSSSSDVQDNNADVTARQPATNPFGSGPAGDQPATDSSSFDQLGSSLPTENQVPNESTGSSTGTAASPKVSQTSALDGWMPYLPFLIVPLLLGLGYVLWRRFSNRGQHHDYESQRYRERTEERPEQVAPDQVPRKTFRELNEPAAETDDAVVNLSDDAEPISVDGDGLTASAIDADVVSIEDDEVSSLVDDQDLDMDIVVEAEEVADPQLASVGIADEESDDDIISFFDNDDGEVESLTDDVDLEQQLDQQGVLSSLSDESPNTLDGIESAADSLDAEGSLETIEDDDEDLISLFGDDEEPENQVADENVVESVVEGSGELNLEDEDDIISLMDDDDPVHLAAEAEADDEEIFALDDDLDDELDVLDADVAPANSANGSPADEDEFIVDLLDDELQDEAKSELATALAETVESAEPAAEESSGWGEGLVAAGLAAVGGASAIKAFTPNDDDLDVDEIVDIAGPEDDLDSPKELSRVAQLGNALAGSSIDQVETAREKELQTKVLSLESQLGAMRTANSKMEDFYQQQKTDSEAEISSLQGELETLKLASKEEDNENYRQQLEEQRNYAADLDRQVQSLKDEVQTNKQEAESSVQEVESFKVKLADTEKDADDLRAQVATLQEELDSAKTEAAEAAANVEATASTAQTDPVQSGKPDAEEAKGANADDYQALEKKLNHKLRHLEAAIEHNRELQAMLDAQEESHKQELESLQKKSPGGQAERNEYQELEQALNKRLKESESKSAELEAELEQLRNSADEAEKLRVELGEKSNAFSALTNSFAAVETRLIKAESDVGATDQLRSELVEAQEKAKDLEELTRQLEEQLEASKSENETLTKSSDQQSSATDQIRRELADAQENSKEFEQLAKQLEEQVEASRSENETLKKSSEEQSIQRDETKADLDKARKEYVEQIEACSQLEVTVASLKSENATLAELQDELRAKLVDAESLAFKASADESKLAELEAQNQSSADKHAAEIDSLRSEIQFKQSELESSKSELHSIKSKTSEADGELQNIKSELQEKNLQLDKAAADLQGSHQEVEKLKLELEDQKRQRTRVVAELNQLNEQVAGASAAKSELETKMTAVEAKLTDAESERARLITQRDANAAIATQASQLKIQLASLTDGSERQKEQVQNLQAKISELETQAKSSEDEHKKLEASLEAKSAEADRIAKANQDYETEISRLRSKTEQLEQERTSLELKASQAVKKAEAARDELSSAQTEFAFQEKRSLVNRKSNTDKTNTNKVAKKTVAKPKSAKATKKSSGSKKSVQSKKGSSKSKPDNLKKIEGIGPKIEKLLHAAGIKTFKKLSATSQKKLLGILKDAGPRFTGHTPETWPEQARLAGDGKWDELDALQDQLDGGRRTNGK